MNVIEKLNKAEQRLLCRSVLQKEHVHVFKPLKAFVSPVQVQASMRASQSAKSAMVKALNVCSHFIALS